MSHTRLPGEADPLATAADAARGAAQYLRGEFSTPDAAVEYALVRLDSVNGADSDRARVTCLRWAAGALLLALSVATEATEPDA